MTTAKIMCFRDEPYYPDDVPAMPRPHHVREYFRRYAAAHGIEDYIRFRSRVVRCRKRDGGGDGVLHWEVIAEEWNDEYGRTEEVVYRSRRLVVCTGHHRRARVPSLVRGLRHFRGQMLHSSAFRSPRQFKEGSTVLIIGGGISGADIAKILRRDGRMRVLVSVREWRAFPHGILLRGMRREGSIRPGVRRVDGDGTVRFDKDASTPGGRGRLPATPVRPDVIIFATGYLYDYPFLPRDGGFVSPDGFKMRRLYLRMIYADDPSLVFMHVPTMTLSPIMLMEYQSRWYARYVLGDFEVTRGDMEEEIRSRKDDRTADDLRVVVGYVPYVNSLAIMAGDITFWRQMLWIRFPMMINSLWNTAKRALNYALFADKWKEL